MKKIHFSIDKIKIFSDFDGTITSKDIGDELFIALGEFEPYHSRLVSGEMNIFDYWNTLCRSLRPEIDLNAIEDFAKNCEIDPYFRPFYEYCLEKGISITVISDGFDSYIKPVLKKAGADNLQVFCNKMVQDASGNFEPVFPGATESCSCKCASCKRNAMLSNCSDDDIIVYIGDGYSDFCAAEHSDIVFAKNHLAAYCSRNKIPHYSVSGFFDVKRIFDKLLKEKPLKQRHQARLLRKKAYEVE